MKQPPRDWGHDPLTQYLDTARANAYATFANWKPEFSNLLEIDSLFRIALGGTPKEGDQVPAIFMFRSHGAYLAAVLLALGGAVADLPMLLRGSLEYALYGLHVHRKPSAGEIWMRRVDSQEAEQQTRREFRIATIWETLASADEDTCQLARETYNEAIEHGAHPNIGALATTVNLKQTEKTTELEHTYLASDPLSRVFCCATTAKTGYTCLRILQATYPESFGRIGIPTRMSALKEQIVSASRARMRDAGIGPTGQSPSERTPSPEDDGAQ